MTKKEQEMARDLYIFVNHYSTIVVVQQEWD